MPRVNAKNVMDFESTEAIGELERAEKTWEPYRNSVGSILGENCHICKMPIKPETNWEYCPSCTEPICENCCQLSSENGVCKKCIERIGNV